MTTPAGEAGTNPSATVDDRIDHRVDREVRRIRDELDDIRDLYAERALTIDATVARRIDALVTRVEERLGELEERARTTDQRLTDDWAGKKKALEEDWQRKKGSLDRNFKLLRWGGATLISALGIVGYTTCRELRTVATEEARTQVSKEIDHAFVETRTQEAATALQDDLIHASLIARTAAAASIRDDFDRRWDGFAFTKPEEDLLTGWLSTRYTRPLALEILSAAVQAHPSTPFRRQAGTMLQDLVNQPGVVLSRDEARTVYQALADTGVDGLARTLINCSYASDAPADRQLLCASLLRRLPREQVAPYGADLGTALATADPLGEAWLVLLETQAATDPERLGPKIAELTARLQATTPPRPEDVRVAIAVLGAVEGRAQLPEGLLAAVAEHVRFDVAGNNLSLVPIQQPGQDRAWVDPHAAILTQGLGALLAARGEDRRLADVILPIADVLAGPYAPEDPPPLFSIKPRVANRLPIWDSWTDRRARATLTRWDELVVMGSSDDPTQSFARCRIQIDGQTLNQAVRWDDLDLGSARLHPDRE